MSVSIEGLPTSRSERSSRWTGRIRMPTSSVLILMIWTLLILAAMIATVMAQPEWWTWIAPEKSLAREMSTSMLLASSCLAAVLAYRRPLQRRVPMVLAFGFFALAVDERVAIHERLRDRALAPRNVTLPFVPWGEPGDVVLVLVAIVGLLSLRPILRFVSRDKSALSWFVAGVVLAVVAVGLDTLPIESYQLRNEIYLQSGEEAIELAAAACFLSALVRLAWPPSGAAIGAS